MNSNITFCGVFRNEAQRVRYVLDIAKRICGNMVLVVQKSEDATRTICSEYTDNIIDRPPESPEISKDFIMEKCPTTWTFWLDADEIPSLELIDFVKNFDTIKYQDFDAIRFPRINYIEGYRIEANESEDEQYRMMKNSVRWNAVARGQIIHIHPAIKAPMFMDLPLFHHRSLEKIEKSTERWNELEPKTKPMCNAYLSKVKEHLSNSKK
jgi:hypothetical protein